MTHILFVCTGNVSRSFLAENLLRHELHSRTLTHVSVSSAGLFAYPGSPPDPMMLDFLAGEGIENIPEHTAKRIRKEDVDSADMILVMERMQAEALIGAWPYAYGKVALLGKFISKGPVEDDIPDPIGRSPYHYRFVQAQIGLAVKNLAEGLLPEKREDHHAQNQDPRGG